MRDRRALSSLVTVALLALASPAHAERAAGLPTVRSEAAAVLDLRTGAEVFGKHPDEVRPIASTTKIFVALAIRRKGIDLDGWTEILPTDVRAAKGGSRTRLDQGQTFKNIDLLRAMLMASDNRAPTALGRAAGMDREQLIAEMNDVARELGLKKTRFTDSSGLRGNVSTARELALALRTALKDPVLAEVMSTRWAEVKSKSGYNKIQYGSTNQPLIAGTYKVLGGKTGFTKAAGYCFVTGAEIDDHAYVIAVLGGDGKQTRFADFSRMAAWLDDGAPGAQVKPRAEAKAAPPAVKRRPAGKARRR
jgi:serine-type D-Ala-D-Ala endopeptidase (penicillin-binding protein 7)